MYIIKKIFAGIAALFLFLTALPLFMLKQYIPAVGFTLVAVAACRYVLRPKPTPPPIEEYTPPYILTNDDYDRIYGTGKYSGMDNIDESPEDEPTAEAIQEEPAASAEPQAAPYTKENYERAMEAYRKMMENKKDAFDPQKKDN